MKTIGIIGTHGKTSILYILELLFFECKKSVGVIGDLGVHVNKNKIYDKCVSIHDSIKEMDKYDIEFLLIELHEKDNLDIIFDCIIFSDFSDCKYTNEREVFFRQFIKKTKNIVVNSDSELSLGILKGISNLYTITYGLNHKSTVTASAIEIVQERMQFNYYLQRGITSQKGKEIIVQEMPVEINLIGYQTIYNALASITTAFMYDLDIEIVIKALGNIKPIPNRLELKTFKGIPLLMDMANDSHSFKMLFETLQYLYYKKMFIAISINNIENLLQKTSIEDFIDDFSLIQGASISIIGELKEKRVERESRSLLVEAVIKNKLIFNHFIDIETYFNEFSSKFTKDDLFVWIGSKTVIEP